jgi:hypothetical protein
MLGHGRTLTILASGAGRRVCRRAVRSWLYAVRAEDPMILARRRSVLVIAAVATIIPAARAASISSSKVLRSE